MAESFFLSANAHGQMREIARRVLREEVGTLLARNRESIGTGLNTYVIKSSTGGISARTTSGTGTGTATVYFRSTAGVLTQNSTLTVDVRNHLESAVDGGKFLLAHQDVFGSLWPAGGVSTSPRIVEVDLSADLCGGTPSVSSSGLLLPARTSIDITSDTLTNTMNRRAKNGDTVRMIEVDNNPVTWDVMDVPLRTQYNVIGIEDTDECLRAWGHQQAVEWCASDETITAKEVVDYVDCEGDDAGSCNLTVTFSQTYMSTT